MSVVSLSKDTDMAVVTSHKNRGLRVLQLLEIQVHVTTLFPRFFFLIFLSFFICLFLFFLPHQVRLVGCFYKSDGSRVFCCLYSTH